MQVDAQVEQGIDPALTDSATAETWLDRVSVADGLYLLALTAAAIMRFSQLGAIPLSPAEAGEALAAWQILQPGSLEAAIGSPAYFTLTSLLIPLLGASDAVVRLVPAIFGVALTGLPWLLRRQVGLTGALIAASLLAASPLNSAISRTAGGDAIALFAVLLVAVSATRYFERVEAKWFYILGGALGLGLASSPLFYGGLLTLTAALLFARLSDREFPIFAVLDRKTITMGAITSVVVFLALSTRFLTYPPGIGTSAQLAGDWLSQFGFSDSLQSIAAPFLALARYELALLILGTVAVIWAVWRGVKFAVAQLLWLVLVLALILLQSSTLSNILLATLPGYLLIGLASAYILERPVNRWTWAFTGGLLLVGAVLLVNVTRYLRVSIYEQDLSNLWIGLLALAAAVLLVYYFWALTDTSIPQGLLLAALIFLLAYEWGTAWHLTHSAANDTRESWVTEGTDNDLRLLLATLQDISQQTTNSASDLQLFSAADTAILRWYLRDFHQAVIGQTVPPEARHPVILSWVEDGEPLFGADYVGSDFGLLRSGVTAAPASERPLSDTLRWWLFHETASEIIEKHIILWVRSDLVLPQQ